LKILSRVTAPTSGQIKVKGRVASLLEVGTGFHPELTGRENIFMNGAILGMNRHEISRKFDEIVAFSGVEKYIDTPVKRYSSGMYVRLAFAVAAHLDPDILVVDEVLAVGDIAFQKKSFDKMEEAGKSGRTVLVVSHNMTMINRLCSSAVLLNSGRLETQGATMDVVQQYLALNLTHPGFHQWDDARQSPGNDVVRLKQVRVCTADGVTRESFDIRRPILIEFEYRVLQDGAILHPSFFLMDSTGTIVFLSGGMHAPDWVERPRAAGLYISQCEIPGNFLAEGTFSIRAIANTAFRDKKPVVHFDVRDAVSFNVHDTIEGDSARGAHVGAYYGVVRPILKWDTHLEGN
jgi:lipopolysaccharide transport system ATP-binding protein